MIWIGVVVAVLVLGVGGALLKRAHANPSTGNGSDPSAGLSDADRVRRIAPAAPMIGLEAALDGVTDGQGRTLREQLDAGAPGVEQLRVHDDTSPILRRALDQVAPATDVPTHDADASHDVHGDGSNDGTPSGE